MVIPSKSRQKSFSSLPLSLSLRIWAKGVERIRLKARSKYRSTFIFRLGNTPKVKCTRMHGKLCHSTPHLFRSHIKRKMMKHFNNENVLNAHVPHYSLEKPKQCMTVDSWKTIFKIWPRLLKNSPNTQNAWQVLEEIVSCREKAQRPTTTH